MSGCGGNCQCSAKKSEEPRPSLADALAKVIIDNRVIRFVVETLQKNPELNSEDVITIVNDAKTRGEL